MKIALHKPEGFTFVEVLVATVLATLAIVGVVAITSNVSRQLGNELVTGQAYDLSNHIRGMIGFEPSCRLALGGSPNFGGPYSAANLKAPQLPMDPTNPTNIILFQPDASTPRNKYLDPADNTQNGKFNQFNNWKVTSLTLAPVSGTAPRPGVVPAKLTIVAEHDNSAGVKTTGRKIDYIFLSVQLDAAGHIQSCFPITYGTDGSPIPICNSPNEAATSRGPHIECRLITCPAGHAATGFNANGDITCNGCFTNQAACAVNGDCCSGNCSAAAGNTCQ